jgi:hypothetical protein
MSFMERYATGITAQLKSAPIRFFRWISLASTARVSR